MGFPGDSDGNKSASISSCTEKETLLEMIISLVNANVSYKRVTSIQFSDLLLCQLLLLLLNHSVVSDSL